MNAIQEGAARMIALIEDEIDVQISATKQTLTEDASRREAFMQASITGWRAAHGNAYIQLQQANATIDHLLRVLTAFGVTCGPNGEVVGYSAEWEWLGALTASERFDGQEDTAEISETTATLLDPLRELAKVRLLLEQKEVNCKYWEDMCIEMKADLDKLKTEN